jgi:outer membrane lipoprotein-sorting protein
MSTALLFSASAAAQDKAAPEAAAAEKAEPGLPTVDELFKKAETTIKGVKDYSGKMIKRERFDDDVEKTIMSFKFQRPFKVYLKFHDPHEGREVIYIPGWNDNELKVHKGSFPDITLNLDPYGGTAMDDNHHPITHFGLENTIKMTGINLRRAQKRGDGEFKVSDGGTMFGKKCWKIDARFPKGGYFTTAKEDETLWDISKRTMMDMFMIMYTNEEFDDPDDPDEGDKVFIPRYYGGRAEFYLDKETGLPVKLSTWDWAGRLYESYEYPEIKLNPGLTKQDFNPDNPKYDF